MILSSTIKFFCLCVLFQIFQVDPFICGSCNTPYNINKMRNSLKLFIREKLRKYYNVTFLLFRMESFFFYGSRPFRILKEKPHLEFAVHIITLLLHKINTIAPFFYKHNVYKHK